MPPATPQEPAKIGRRIALLSAGTMLSRLLGMVRETLIAATFSLGETDAFFIAWRIPNALRALLAEGALSSAFVPVFTEALTRGPDAFKPVDPTAVADPKAAHLPQLQAVVARVRALSLLVLIPLSALGVLCAGPVLRVTAGDFGGDPEQFALATSLLRWLFPYIFFMGSAAVGVAALQTIGRFNELAFAPALLNVAFLLSPVIFVPLCVRAGLPAVHGLALGALLGGALQLVAIAPALRRAGLLQRPVLDLQHPGVRRVGTLLAPVVFGLAIYQVDVVLSSRFLAGLPRGSASYFNYAQRLADIPQGVFILAVSGSFLPELSAAMARGDRAEGQRLLERMIRLAAFVAIPVAVILATYGEAIVPLIYGYGRFRDGGAHQIAEVVRSLRWQAANVALLALVRQFTAAFSAAQNPRGPVIVSFVDLFAFVGLALWLRGPLGHAGVAAAIAGSTVVQLALLAVGVRKHLSIPWNSLASALARVLAASLPVGLLARLLVARVDFSAPGLTSRFAAIAGGTALAGVYVLCAWLLRIEETARVIAIVRRKVRGR